MYLPCMVTPRGRRCPDCLHAIPRDGASPVGAPQLYPYLNKQIYIYIYIYITMLMYASPLRAHTTQ